MMLDWLFTYLVSESVPSPVDWRAEAESAESFGFDCHSFCLETLVDADPHTAFEELPSGRGREIAYRGWMIATDVYESMADALHAKGYLLRTNASQYHQSSHLPEWHPRLADLTPPAIWTDSDDADEAWALAQDAFGPPPWIIKDHLKSRKESWLEACFIADAADENSFADSCRNLVEQRGEHFTGGLVVRPYVPLRLITAHWTGAPIFEEYRLIFWEGELLQVETYNEVGPRTPDFSRFSDLGQRVDSPFFTADIARTETGDLILIEINDGGVSGLPPQLHPDEFYGLVADGHANC